jgi:hypothetical protein
MRMAEQVMLVCDVCGRPAEQSVTIRVGGRGYAKDLCGSDLKALLSGTRAPKRGRRPTRALVPSAIVQNSAPAVRGTRRRRVKP